MSTLEIVEQGTILRATVGSTVHGLHHGGQDDRDEMAVFVEPPEYVLGLRLARKQGVRNPYRFEHWVERTQPEGARSGPGDLDLVAYSLRKYVRLALKGHPTVLLLLFVPDELTLVETELGQRLRQLRPASSPSEPVVATSATCAARRSGCSGRAARSGSTGPSWSRPTDSTRSTRCTHSASATRAPSCWRPGG
jgi:predicted nucleotidyltransferase